MPIEGETGKEEREKEEETEAGRGRNDAQSISISNAVIEDFFVGRKFRTFPYKLFVQN